MKYILPLWIMINCRVFQVLGVLEWTVIEKVTEYGHNVTLFCNVSNCCPQDSGWDMYTPEQHTLFIDVKTGRPNKKYDGKVSGNGYTLIIQNLTKSDLNVSYSCVYGVTIGEIKVLLEEDVFTYISTTQPNTSTGKSLLYEREVAAVIAGVAVLVAVILFLYALRRRVKRKTMYRYIRGEVVLLREESMLINRFEEVERLRFITLMQSSQTEKRYFVKIIIVGKEAVGKTCLMRKLLKEDIKDVSSTDGIHIDIHRSKINIENGKWITEKDIPDETRDSIQSSKTQNQTTQDKPTENIKSEVPKKDMSEVSETLQNTLVIEVEPEKGCISNHSTTNSSQLECSMPTVENKNVKTTDIKNISLDNVSTNINDTEDTMETIENIKKDNKSEMKIKDNVYITSTDTVSTTDENELHRRDISEHLIMPSDPMFDVVTTTSTSNSPSNNYALCGLWDFAGQKEFYCTHQAFLTSSAIYLVVADMKTDILTEHEGKEKTEDDRCSFSDLHEEDYVDFWFDSIHCYRTVDRQEGEPSTDPPVIVVFTGKDRYDKEEMGKRQTYLNDKLTQLHGKRKKYQHYRHKFYVSNTEDPDAIFEQIRNKISEIAQDMHLWGKSVPSKWILLEHLIDVNRDSGKHFISFDDMVKIAKHPKIAISDKGEVSTFLHFQHEVGKIVFFKDIPDLIILEPQWLANAFRCLVSDRFNIDDVKDVSAKDKVQISSDWTHLKKKGEISDLLINTLFKLKGGDSFLTQKNQLLEVMKKFDILLEIEDKTAYIMPSMFPSSSISTVYMNIGIGKDNCQKTSWFCMKFEFLPPSFFNHLLVWLMKKYCPTEVKSTEGFALYRGVCVFDLNSSGCEKLLMTMSTDTIALQIVSFPQHALHLQEVCTSVRKDIRRKIIVIKKRYGIVLSYKQMFKCSDCSCDSDANSYEKLKENKTIFCRHHQMAHESAIVCLPWAVESTESHREEKMKQKHRKVLQTCFEYIVRNLYNVEMICEYLEVDDILTEEMRAKIQYQKLRSEQTMKLLSILPHRGKEAYGSFIEALKRTENTNVADYLSLGQKVGSTDWPDLSKRLQTVTKSSIKMCSRESFKQICGSRQIYSMTSANRGKFILISNTQSIPRLDSQNDQEKKKVERYAKRYSECIRNVDFDELNMRQLFKYLGYESRGDTYFKNLTKEQIKDFLKKELMEIDNDASFQYDSLVIMFSSGKIKADAAEIHDKDGVFLPRNEILQIIKECNHFKGKPKVIFVQTYSFQEESETLDQTDTTANDIIKNGEPNTDDIFVVSNYPRIEQSPWIIGENMMGSYFIQALVHVFKNFACKKSFMELLREANKCLGQAVIPKLTDDGKNSGTVEKKPVAQIVLLEYSEGRELYFFPGHDCPVNVF